jgi:hypothetical protein
VVLCCEHIIVSNRVVHRHLWSLTYVDAKRNCACAVSNVVEGGLSQVHGRLVCQELQHGRERHSHPSCGCILPHISQHRGLGYGTSAQTTWHSRFSSIHLCFKRAMSGIPKHEQFPEGSSHRISRGRQCRPPHLPLHHSLLSRCWMSPTAPTGSTEQTQTGSGIGCHQTSTRSCRESQPRDL